MAITSEETNGQATDRTKSRKRDTPSSQGGFDNDRPSDIDRPARKSSALSDEEREERRQTA